MVGLQSETTKKRGYGFGSIWSYGSKNKEPVKEDEKDNRSTRSNSDNSDDKESNESSRFAALYSRFRKNKNNESGNEQGEKTLKSISPSRSSGEYEEYGWPIRAIPGSCVATKYGTGTLLDIRHTDGFHLIKLVTGAIGYFHYDSFIREIKAVVGERVKTQWGMGIIEAYYIKEDLYEVALDWRWDDDHVWRMKATTEKFEKISERSSILKRTGYYLAESYSSLRDSTSSGYAKTGEYLSEGYTNLVDTTSTGYANMAARIASIAAKRHSPPPVLCKVFTPLGEAELLEIREDQIHVCRPIATGGVAFLQPGSIVYHRSSSKFSVGDRLKTPYGEGIVMHQRPTDGMLEIDLMWKLTNDVSPKIYMTVESAEACLDQSGGRLSSILSMTKKSLQSTKNSASGGFSSVRAKFASMAGSTKRSRYKIDERVLTPFGSGFVKKIRPDGVYLVYLRRMKLTAYMQEHELQPFPYHMVTHYVIDGKRYDASEVEKHTNGRQYPRKITAKNASKLIGATTK